MSRAVKAALKEWKLHEIAKERVLKDKDIQGLFELETSEGNMVALQLAADRHPNSLGGPAKRSALVRAVLAIAPAPILDEEQVLRSVVHFNKIVSLAERIA